MPILKEVVEASTYAQQNQPKYVSATYQMLPYDHSVVTDSSGGVFTITLPPVAECRGMSYHISFGGSGVNAVTIADKANDSGYSDQTIDAVGEHMLLHCNGERWDETSINE